MQKFRCIVRYFWSRGNRYRVSAAIPLVKSLAKVHIPLARAGGTRKVEGINAALVQYRGKSPGHNLALLSANAENLSLT